MAVVKCEANVLQKFSILIQNFFVISNNILGNSSSFTVKSQKSKCGENSAQTCTVFELMISNSKRLLFSFHFFSIRKVSTIIIFEISSQFIFQKNLLMTLAKFMTSIIKLFEILFLYMSGIKFFYDEHLVFQSSNIVHHLFTKSTKLLPRIISLIIEFSCYRFSIFALSPRLNF